MDRLQIKLTVISPTLDHSLPSLSKLLKSMLLCKLTSLELIILRFTQSLSKSFSIVEQLDP